MSLGRRFVSTGAADAVCLTESVQVFGADSTYSSNIALYQLDGNDDDTTENYNGTSDTNVTYSSTGAYIGQAANFNGSNAYIDLGTSIASSTRGVSMWVYADDFTERWAFQQGDGQGVENYIRFYNTDDIQVRWGNVTQTFSGYSANTWYHIFAQKDENDNANVWINGVEMGSTGTPSAIAVNKTHLGVRYNGGSLQYYFKGKIDQVRIFNKALNAQDIATLYAETSSTASNTNPFNEGAGVALYSMDYDASEESGYFDGTPTDVDFGVGGITNFGAKFNGSSSFIQTSLSLDAASNSVSFWFNADSVGSQNPALYFNNRGGRIDITINGTGSNTATSSYENIYINSTTAITGWNFVSIVFTGWASSYSASSYGSAITANVYLNGGSAVSLSPTPYGQSDGLRIGRSGGGYYYDGSIDQVRIFSKALSTSEIDTLYNSGSGETACVHTATTTDNDYPTTNLAYYKLDNSAEDEKGNYDGTQSNIEYRFGRYGQALKYSGASSNVETTLADSNFTSNYSISFWVNLDNANTFQNFVGNYKSSGGYAGFTFMSRDVGSGVYRYGFIWWYNTGALYNYVDNNDVLAISGNWAHLVATKASGELPKLYVNGTATSLSYRNSVTDHATTTENFKIGNTLNTNYSAGLIDQVRIFSSELTSSQVTQLYNEKPETDTSNFKAILYQGSSSKQYISNVGFNLDVDNSGDGGYVWIKQRTTPTRHHRNYDTVRGVYPVYASLNNLQGTSNPIEYDANGFFFAGGESGVNENAEDYVAWVWKAGGTGVTNYVGSLESTVSANPSAGFSIVRYTGTASYTDTVGTGLSSAPEIIIQKSINLAADWYVLFNINGTGAWDWAKLNERDAFQADSPQRFAVSSTTINNWGWNTYNMINYCWHSVSGYSKFATYLGNGTTDNKIYTTDDGTSTGSNGFKPSFVMLKNTSRDNTGWLIHDTARDPVNTSYRTLLANADTNEYTSTTYWLMDFESDGFRLKYGADNEFNKSGDTYLYMAFK